MVEKDQALVKRTLAGDSNAFGDLVDRYVRLVRGVIWEIFRRPDEVEDLVQEVFCKAYEQLSTLRQHSKFASWLWQIATNTALFHLRHQQRQAASAEEQQVLSVYLRYPEEAAEEKEMAGLVWDALDRLDPEYRRIVVLYYFEGCGQREIARFLDLPLTTVKWRLFKARGSLRDELLDKLGHEIQTQVQRKQQLRTKVMAALPIVAFLTPQPRSWLERWAQWKYWAIGTAAGLGIGGLVYQLVQEPANQPSREALRLEQEAHLHSEPSIEWDPPQPRAGQQVRIRVTDLPVKKGDQPELHYLTDPWVPTDHVLPLDQDGEVWITDLEVPKDAVAVFFYAAPRREGPQFLQYGSYLTTQKYLKRYYHSFLVHNEAGLPLRGANHTEAAMAERQQRWTEDILASVDRELALYPDLFPAYQTRWQTLLRAGDHSPEALAQVRAEQQALLARYPDRPEVLWEAAQTGTGQEDTLYRALYQRFPGYKNADEAAYKRTQDYVVKRDEAGRRVVLEEFLRQFPQSRYLDEAYIHYLLLLARIAPDRAGQVADSLINRTLVVPYDPAKERDQGISMSAIGGCLPEGYAYSLRFELLLKEGKAAEALALARRLMTSDLSDYTPYLYLGQKLAGQQSWSILGEDPPVYPLDLGLAIQVLEAGLVWTTPEHLEKLPGFNTYFSTGEQGEADERQLHLDEAYSCRQSVLLALAQGYQAKGEYAPVVRYLEESAALQEKITRHFLDGDRAALLLGEGYERLGRWGEAEQAYLKAVAQDHGNTLAEAALRRMHQDRYGHLEKLQPLLLACFPPAPAFTVRDTLGKDLSLADFKGELLLIYHEDMQSEEQLANQLGALKRWQERYRGEGLEVLHLNRSGKRQRSPFRLAMDDEGVGDKYKFRYQSNVVLIDREGRLRLRQEYPYYSPGDSVRDRQVEEKIEELVQERTPALQVSAAGNP